MSPKSDSSRVWMFLANGFRNLEMALASVNARWRENPQLYWRHPYDVTKVSLSHGQEVLRHRHRTCRCLWPLSRLEEEWKTTLLTTCMRGEKRRRRSRSLPVLLSAWPGASRTCTCPWPPPRLAEERKQFDWWRAWEVRRYFFEVGLFQGLDVLSQRLETIWYSEKQLY